MQTPVHINWEHLEASDFVQQRIEREIAGLEKAFGRITSCEVHIEAPSHRQKHGGLYAVRVRIELPGGVTLAASRNPPEDHAHEDAYVAIRDVFRALRRKLRDRVRKRRDEPQTPDTQPHGLVAELFPDKGYGFIRADDGRDIYFHHNSVLSGFEHLRVGAEVHFAEEAGENGPQASSVHAYGVGARPS